jgi:ADP-ribosylglycohydrolase
MLDKIIDFFSIKKKEIHKNERQKDALKYYASIGSKYDLDYPNELLRVEKTSILFSKEVYELIYPGGAFAPDSDHWHTLFLANEWIYFDRANYFLGKGKIIKYQNGYKILTSYYYNWGNQNLFKDLLLEAIITNLSDKKLINWNNFPYFNNSWIDVNYWNSILIGVAVGDAHGVPYEFKDRETMLDKDLSIFTGFGTHNKPLGTHSDDTSLTLCLAEALLNNQLLIYNYEKILTNSLELFSEWLSSGKWAVNNEVFDVGFTTRKAILKYNNSKILDSGGSEIRDNGNGSLMRILPICIYVYSAKKEDRLLIVKGLSSLTHSHEISIIACLYYILFAINIIENHEKDTNFSLSDIYYQCNTEFNKEYKFHFKSENIIYFNRILEGEIPNLEEKNIKSGGFVVETLECCLWSLLNSKSFAESVIKVIKLGGDTDTNGAVTGGISALFYGYHNIPENWINELIDKEPILSLANKLSEINFRDN